MDNVLVAAKWSFKQEVRVCLWLTKVCTFFSVTPIIAVLVHNQVHDTQLLLDVRHHSACYMLACFQVDTSIDRRALAADCQSAAGLIKEIVSL
jgi:hypothetical protein